MDLANHEYSFRKSYQHHSSDTKCVVCTDLGLLITGGSDCHVCISDSESGEVLRRFPTERSAVNAVAFYRSPQHGWFIFVGKRDGSISVFITNNDIPIIVLLLHDCNVCALRVDSASQKLYSSSWDNSAAIWSLENFSGYERPCNTVLFGHTMSVWDAIPLPETEYCVTASSDRTIRLWDGERTIKVFKGHEDVVRCLVALSSTRFLSCGNDAEIRLWDITEDVSLTKIHSKGCDFIYTMIKLSTTDRDTYIATGGEGGCLEVWNLSSNDILENKQGIFTPAQSIWSLTFLKNEDICAATDDGRVYIFSKSRNATEEDQEEFNIGVVSRCEFMEKRTLHNDEAVTIKVALEDGEPSLDLRYVKGTDPREAAIAFVNANNLPEAYVSQITQYIKSNIPGACEFSQHVNQSKESGVEEQSGRKWDHALDVRTDDGRDLKLYYNSGEDHLYVAQRFVEDNSLPIGLLPKITRLLEEQISSSSMLGTNFFDPYTGEVRYIPSSTGAATNSSEIRANRSEVRSDLDPLTGSGAYRASGIYPGDEFGTDKIRPKHAFLPLNELITYGLERKSDKALERLRDFNELQGEDRLTDAELLALEEIMTKKDFECCEIHANALSKGLYWSDDMIVPILDIFRIAILNKVVNDHFCSITSEVYQYLGEETIDRLTALLLGENSDAAKIFACRALVNCAVHECGCDMLRHEVHNNVLAVIPLIQRSNVLQIVSASFIANLSLILLRGAQNNVTELGPREDALRAISEGIENIADFGSICDAALLLLVQAIATFMWGDSTLIRTAISFGFTEHVERIKDASTNDSVKIVSRAIEQMIRAV